MDTVTEVRFEEDNRSVVMAPCVEGATVDNALLDTVFDEVLAILATVVLAALVTDLTVDWLFEDEDTTTTGDAKEERSFAAVVRLVPRVEIPLLLASVAVVFDAGESPVTGFAVDVELSAVVVPSIVLLSTVVEPTSLAVEFELFTR